MPRATIPPLMRNKGETLALTTARRYSAKYPWAKELQYEADVASRVVLTPRLMAAFFFDESAGTYLDVTENMTDKDAATLMVINSMTSSDFIYLFFEGDTGPIAAFFMNLTALNDTASIMSLDYRKDDDTWAAVSSLTDGTDVSGDTLKQDGEVSWTLTTDHKAISPNAVTGAGTGVKAFAVRISVSVTLDSSVDVNEIIAGPDDANSQFIPATTLVTFNVEKRGGIVAFVGTSTGTAHANHLEYDGN